jgi:hypothetical protein
MYKMEISLLNHDDIDGDPIEVEVQGESIEFLKNDLNGIILDTVEAHDKESGSYNVYVMYTKDGEYVDCDEIDCTCILPERIIMY